MDKPAKPAIKCSMVDTITPSEPITVARLVSTTQLKRAEMAGLSGRSLLINFIPWLADAGFSVK